MTILLTGASGYLGSLLMELWLQDERVQKIIAIDLKEPQFIFSENHPKVHFIKKNIKDLDLEKELGLFFPIDVVAHAAYIIRTPFFKKDLEYQKASNFESAENIFKFAFRNNIPKLIHFSTVAVYGAKKINRLDQPFSETAPLSEDKIAYGQDKKIIELKLEELYSKYKPQTQVSVLRIGSVAGPFGKNIVKKSGLQSFFRGFLPFIPVVSRVSARQFIHEDDIVRSVNFCAEANLIEKYTVFNLAPQGYLTFTEIAKILGKTPFHFPRFLARFFFWLVWYLSFGKIPTPPHVVNSYSFPIIVDGTKINQAGLNYIYTGLDAFLALKGKHAEN